MKCRSLLLTEGVPGNGKPYPDDSMVVKIEYSRKNTCLPILWKFPTP
jgi:hypothetical protein